MNQLQSRKSFLRKIANAVPALMGMSLIGVSCHSNESNGKRDDDRFSKSCDDLSGISDNDLKARKNFSYVAISPDKIKECQFCNLYIQSKLDSDCGGCMLFKGPVHAEGSCTYWTQKTERTE